MSNKIEGKEIQEEILAKLKEQEKPKRILAVIKVGENEAQTSFIKIKKQAAEKLGIDFRVYEFDEKISNEKLREEVGRIARQGGVGGILVQLPLPEGINRQKILNVIPIEKDVDVLSEKAWASFSLGRSRILPPSVGVVEEILKQEGWDLNDKKVAVVGAGFLVGKPVAEWLSGRVKKLSIFDEGSELEELRDYDLVVSGVGKAGIIKPEYLKEGAGVIDFGYDLGKGDLDASNEDELEKLAFWTPTPGGTGPILVAKLMENFYKLNENRE